MSLDMADEQKTWTIGSLLQWTQQYFSGKGVENPRLDAELLLCHVLGKDRLYLYVHFDQPLYGHELAAFRELVKKRGARVPVAYILGEKGFMGLSFKVSPAVLIPRPETELLVEAVLETVMPLQKPHLLDLGTGSGAIIVSLLGRCQQATGVAVDLSAAALAVAAENARQNGVAERLTLLQGDLFAPLPPAARFDAIVSNPPYIPAADVDALVPEVQKEPRLALDGGRDGLDYYRRLAEMAPNYIKPGGLLALEIGIDQHETVPALLRAAGWQVQPVRSDYGGVPRVVLAVWRGDES